MFGLVFGLEGVEFGAVDGGVWCFGGHGGEEGEVVVDVVWGGDVVVIAFFWCLHEAGSAAEAVEVDDFDVVVVAFWEDEVFDGVE